MQQCCIKALQFVVASHMISFNHLEFFISSLRSNAILKFVHDIASSMCSKVESSAIITTLLISIPGLFSKPPLSPYWLRLWSTVLIYSPIYFDLNSRTLFVHFLIFLQTSKQHNLNIFRYFVQGWDLNSEPQYH